MQPVRGLPFVLKPGLTVALTPPALDRDRFTTVEAVTDLGDAWRVRFDGIGDLTAAEGVAGCFVLARAADVNLGPLDVAYDVLVGRAVVDERYGVLGTIAEVMETPANDVWVVSGGAYGEVLLPVIEQVVAAIPDDGAIAVTVLDGIIEAPAPAVAEAAPAGGDASCA